MPSPTGNKVKNNILHSVAAGCGSLSTYDGAVSGYTLEIVCVKE